ncbi:hypothetical protein HLB23_07655 [Nocardia uniformis]|uniref:Secreted protein n=1 Tax=Nocardia uniformis TaxID=53432 RepID=A0A849BSZ5_9NOCA|nr:hypothetical protein [Nocardia uniformis]NNH69742.1 hypothetical protein [Nocardia uniformis]
MNGRTLRRAASAAIAATTVVLGTTAIAYAEPEPAPKTPVEVGIDNLTEAADDNAEAVAAVQSTAKTAQLITAARLGNVAFAPFAYQAPTIGCGHNMPFTMTVASAVSGGTPDSLGTAPGSLRFQAVTAHSGMPLASGLSVVWLNVNNGRSGINALDDISEYNLPSLSKTVESGAGTVIASLWGTIDYPGARCLVTPTVGLFTVPDLPVEPQVEAPGAPPVENAPAPAGTNDTGSNTPPA